MFRSKRSRDGDPNDETNRPDAAEGAADVHEVGDGAEPGDPDATADLIDTLAAERDAARAELAEANDKHLRALADFQNYQRRALQNEQEAKRQGAQSMLLSILPVLDHFDLALGQDPGKASAEQIMIGVRAIRDELLKALGQHGIVLISPEPGEEFDPNRHQALSTRPTPDVPAGSVHSVFQIGYALGERVIRPAKVCVASAAGPATGGSEG